eukprot:TRINITY_DN15881_c0_g1_i4.p1 TRINITY_DN15881_c0_g1~~TRINITY_DN15881_c0_g1_i4.p1  ORF type:complete len:482 (+),score=121.56 TRINITY_DN15881_c0_g1_i4:156-1601(+)
MTKIMERDYDRAREVLRHAVATGLSKGIAEQYGGVLQDFLQKRDEIENPIIVATKGACQVRDIDKDTGRGLVTPKYVSWGEELYNERPLMYIQSPDSRKASLACCACLIPVGSLADQLKHLGVDAPAGSEAISACFGRAEDSPRTPRPLVPCPGCKEVFCSTECRDYALAETSHAELCSGRMPQAMQESLRELEQLAEETEQENLLLLAHGIAVMLLRRRQGVPLEQVLKRYAGQFISRPWDDPGLPELSGETPEQRRDMLSKVEKLLRNLYAGEVLAQPFLETKLLSGLLGTFELVNMCISLPNALNREGEKVCELLDGATLARIGKIQEAVNDDDSDGECEDEEEEGDHAAEEEYIITEEDIAEAVESAKRGDLWSNVVGTALVETLAFTNHSCMPNARVDFAAAGRGGASGKSEPGLWVFALARRPLMPGDEVLMSYVPSVSGKPLAVRQQRMKKFGFPCRCRSCITDEMLEAEGEIR